MAAPANADKIKTALVTGAHPHDPIALQAAFHSMGDVQVYPQNMEDFAGSPAQTRRAYDVVVFYNMHTQTPEEALGGWQPLARQALEELGETPQGLVILHHAILAYPRWPLWGEVVGLERETFGYHFDQTVRVHVANPDHFITRGLTDWEMVDETYSMPDCDPRSEVLLTIEHPLSMKTVGWTRQYKKSPVFCFQCGHDWQTYGNPSFRTVLWRGIQWVAGRQ